jgi:AAA15 family ATPase/GTPase
MLVQFVVENFLSFKDKQILSMRAPETGAARIGAAFQEGRRQTVRAGGEEILRCAAIYGANASGKSNLVRALDFVRHLVLEGTDSNRAIAWRPFKLDPACRDRPSRFELAFIHEDTLHSYGFVLDSERIHAEWLYRGPEDTEALLFRRELDTASGQYTFEVGDALASEPKRKLFYEFLHEGTRPNQLFLREAQDRKAPELEPHLSWFRERLHIVSPHTDHLVLADFVLADPGFRGFLVGLLARVDVGITNVDIESLPDVPLSAMLELAFRKAPDALKELAPSLSFGPGRVARVNEQGETEGFKVTTSHGDGENAATFDLDEESDGTQRLMHLATVLYSWRNIRTPRVFVIDELDRSLHPLLTRFFLQEFLRASDMTSANQLICTTHDTNLLDVNLLPPSSIWFVEKDRAGSSHLYSLDEFDETQLTALRDHTEEGYLAGRFGAIPFFGNRRRLITDPGPEGADEG